MKITINESPEFENLEIIINCKSTDESLLKLITSIRAYDKKVTGTKDGQVYIFQYLFYVWDLFGNLSRFKKSTICYFTLMIVGTGFVNIFNWFDLSNMKNIAIALISYTIIFVSMCWVYNLYYKVTGEEYNEKLKLYKSSK